MEYRLRDPQRRLTRFLALAALLWSAASPASHSGSVYAQNTAGKEAPAPETGSNRDGSERFDFADGLFARNLYDLAVGEYRKLLEEYPEHPRKAGSLFGLAESLFHLKRYDEAAASYADFLQHFPEHPQNGSAGLRMGEILLETGHRNEALRRFQALSQKTDASISSPAHFFAATIFLEKDKRGLAAKHLQALLNAPVGEELGGLAHYYLGEINLKNKNFKNAALYFQKALNAQSADIRQLASLGLGRTAFARQELDQALSYFSKAYDLDPAAKAAQDALSGKLNTLHKLRRFEDLLSEGQRGLPTEAFAQAFSKWLMADALVQLKRYPEALKLLEEALAGAGLSPKEREKAEIYKLETLLASAQTGQALIALEAMNPKRNFFQDRWLYLKYEILKASGRADLGSNTLAEILRQHPNSEYAPKALLSQAYAELSNKNLQAAHDCFSEFLHRYPAHPLAEETAKNRMVLKIQTGNLEGALQNAAAFLKDYPGSPYAADVHWQLASLYLKTKDYPKARQTFQEFLATRAPDDAQKQEALFFLGLTCQFEGSLKEAVSYYVQVREELLSKKMLKAFLKNAAFAYIQLERYEDAMALYRAFLKRFPAGGLTPEVFFWMAEEQLKEKKTDEIILLMDQFANRKDSPKFVHEIEYYRAEAELIKNNPGAALPRFDKSLAAGERFAVRASLGKARAFCALQKFDDAVFILEELLKDSSDDLAASVRARMLLADTYAQKGAFLEAAKTYLSIGILYEDPETVPDALFKAGEAFEKAARPEEARNAYQELLDRFKGHPLAARASERLNKPKTAAPAP